MVALHRDPCTKCHFMGRGRLKGVRFIENKTFKTHLVDQCFNHIFWRAEDGINFNYIYPHKLFILFFYYF